MAWWTNSSSQPSPIAFRPSSSRDVTELLTEVRTRRWGGSHASIVLVSHGCPSLKPIWMRISLPTPWLAFSAAEPARGAGGLGDARPDVLDRGAKPAAEDEIVAAK